AVQRWLYKDDDRAEGTTLDNEGSTRIGLFGLNPTKNRLFLLEQREATIAWQPNSKSRLALSLILNNVEINRNLAADVPGTNQKNPRYTFRSIRLGGMTKHRNLIFFANYNRELNTGELRQGSTRII